MLLHHSDQHASPECDVSSSSKQWIILQNTGNQNRAQNYSVTQTRLRKEWLKTQGLKAELTRWWHTGGSHQTIMSPGNVLWELKLMMGKQGKWEECPLVAIMCTLVGGCNKWWPNTKAKLCIQYIVMKNVRNIITITMNHIIIINMSYDRFGVFCKTCLNIWILTVYCS